MDYVVNEQLHEDKVMNIIEMSEENGYVTVLYSTITRIDGQQQTVYVVQQYKRDVVTQDLERVYRAAFLYEEEARDHYKFHNSPSYIMEVE